MAELRPEKRRSLRRTFFSRYFFFTLIPLTIVAVVVLLQYKKTIESQIQDRLTAHIREVEALFAKERGEIEKFVEFSAANKQIVYYLSALDSVRLRDALTEKISEYSQKKITAYTHGGQVFALYDEGFLSVHGPPDLPRNLMLSLEDQKHFNRVRFTKRAEDTFLNLSVIKAVPGIQGKTAGYIEAYLSLDRKKLAEISKKTGSEVFFFNKKGKVLVGTLPGKELKKLKLGARFLKRESGYFEDTIDGIPYAFVSTVLRWGDRQFLVGMGVNTTEGRSSIRTVSAVIAFAYGCFLLFSFFLSLFFLREFIRPVEDLTEAMGEMKDSRKVVYVQNESDTELGDLIKNFNEMSLTIHESDSQLKKQVKLLEMANGKIKRAQGQLVQSAKLASLGELVAGIAHELNNPIGFIYSNMEHLKAYSESLIGLIEAAQKSGAVDPKLLEEIDFNYIKDDLPKLVKSCEEGAVRAKDIVIGLRNFSRTEDAFRSGFDVNDGLDSTLKLLKSAISSTMVINKSYGKIPKIFCNGNQIKQVFMNIISNGLHALGTGGELKIITDISTDQKSIEVQVIDNGPGIPEHIQEKIFDPFFTTKEVGKGTGLGLSISYGIIQSHQGELEMHSKVDQGSEFLIRLPIQPEKEGADV